MKTLFALLILCPSVLFSQTTQIFEFSGSIYGISGDGMYACGFDLDLGQSFIWTEAGGKVPIGTGTEVYGISNDGTVAGRFLDPNTITNGNPTWVAAYYSGGQWYKVGGIPGIPPLDEYSYTHAYSINAGGTVMTGMVWRPNYRVEPCYWNIPDTSIQLLGQINGQSGRADDVSDDGSMIVGWSADSSGSPDREPYYWDPLPHFMGTLDSTWDGGECNGISPDGNILVGNSSAFAFQYTKTTGMKSITDPTLGYWNGWSSDVSNNGTAVGHIDEAFFTYRASIKLAAWDYTILLDTYLKDTLGIAGIDDWYCLFNRAVSADGSVFGGEMVNDTYPFGNGGFIVKTETPVSVETEFFSPQGYALKQNYPNPFNPTTMITFAIPHSELVNLTVYNSLGQEVAVLANEEFAAGQHEVRFDATGLASGVYLVEMSAGNYTKAQKMNLLK